MKSYSFLLLIFLIFPAIGWAQSDNQRAREIFEEVDQRRSSITSETAEMQMVIYNSSGDTRSRTLQSFSFNEGDISKSLLIFKEPANVRGTAFLNVSEGDSEMQKLYLPALGRIQTISASQKSDRFMGSDFTYEDLGDQNPDDYTFSLEAETDTAYVLYAEKEGASQYDHFRFYIHPKKYTPTHIEYFDADGQMIKKLVAEDFEQVGDQLWQPSQMTMYDLANNRRTELIWQNRSTGDTIPQWRFTERGLRRGL
ncbi:MAG: outer membrane lipoprotein-sorting protein [Fodinibius sp.]|nr:outer membrane lipoprotein-sorting protein [Fodinibius sp.]